MSRTTDAHARLREHVLAWGESSLRDLPWREVRDPWAILVSETMAQQTQVARVVPRWEAFLSRWPTAAACAQATTGEVIEAWQGLGYNRRAVALHRAAVTIVERHDGVVPDDLEALLELPGVGPYTARAVLAFAFERDVAVVDVNVGRVLSRAVAGEPLTARAVQSLADELVPDGRGWLWNQSVMELGAVHCTKRRPSCAPCPVAATCAWRGVGGADGDVPDPAATTATTGRPQGRFEGSDRQLRGRLVDALRAGPVDRADVADVLGLQDPERLERLVRSMVAQGLVEIRGAELTLPGLRPL